MRGVGQFLQFRNQAIDLSVVEYADTGHVTVAVEGLKLLVRKPVAVPLGTRLRNLEQIGYKPFVLGKIGGNQSGPPASDPTSGHYIIVGHMKYNCSNPNVLGRAIERGYLGCLASDILGNRIARNAVHRRNHHAAP